MINAAPGSMTGPRSAALRTATGIAHFNGSWHHLEVLL